MKQFKIYEIPGVKIGATDRWPKRVIEQGYQPEDCNILFETDVLKLASSMEQVLQKKHGYEVDTARYETNYNIHHGKVVSDKTRQKHSEAVTKTNEAIAADPIRAALRSQQRSISTTKNNAEIAADPIRSMHKSQKCAKAKSKPVSQIDTNTGVILGVFKSRKIAGWLMGHTGGCNISAVIGGRQTTAGGYLWNSHG